MPQCPQCGASATELQAICVACGADLGTGQLQAAGGGAEGTARTSLDPTSPPHAPTAQRSAAGPPQAGAPGPRPATDATAAGSPTSTSPFAGALPLVTAVLLTALLQELITSVVPPEAYVYRLFRPAGGWVMAVVPGMIAFVFVWTIADLILKYRAGRTNARDLGRSEVRQLPMLLGQEDARVTLQRMRGWDRRLLARPVGRRISWLLRNLSTTDVQSTHEVVRHQADLDADSASSAYRTVRLFIWAMPILGFIGTVLGISLAVGGFSDFLTTNVSIDEIDAVTAELGEVASGLSFAFDTTLLGLLAGLVASVGSSIVQAREERLLTGLEELGLMMMASARPSSPAAASAAARADVPPDQAFDRMMRERIGQLGRQMDEFTRAVRSGLDGFLGEWAKLPPEVERVAADLTGLRTHLGAAAKSTDQLVLETRVLLEGLKEASSRWGTGLEATIGSVNQTVESLGEELQSVSQSLERSVGGLSQRLTSEESVQRLSTSISDLADRLDEVRRTQDALTPLLSQLAGPLELRLTPQPRAASRDGE